MKCTDIQPLLTDYVYRELNPADEALIGRHISICNKCSNELSYLNDMLKLFKDRPPLTDYEKKSQDVIRRLETRPVARKFSWVRTLAVAAAILLVFGSLWLLLLQPSKGQPQENVIENILKEIQPNDPVFVASLRESDISYWPLLVGTKLESNPQFLTDSHKRALAFELLKNKDVIKRIYNIPQEGVEIEWVEKWLFIEALNHSEYRTRQSASWALWKIAIKAKEDQQLSLFELAFSRLNDEDIRVRTSLNRMAFFSSGLSNLKLVEIAITCTRSALEKEQEVHLREGLKQALSSLESRRKELKEKQ